MKRIRLLIADADRKFISEIQQTLGRSLSIAVVGAAVSGKHALDLLSACQPDVLLTDINLPELDGIHLLKHCRRMSAPPACIVCTRFYSDLCVEYASRNGATFFLYKPVDGNRLAEIIVDCWRGHRAASGKRDGEETSAGLDRAVDIRALLQTLGFPVILSGTRYIMDAATCLADDRRLLKNLSSGLYPRIAKRSGVTSQCVERAIRCAIARAYERGALRRCFPVKPTNRDLLRYILRRLDENGDAVIPAALPVAESNNAQKHPSGIL